MTTPSTPEELLRMADDMRWVCGMTSDDDSIIAALRELAAIKAQQPIGEVIGIPPLEGGKGPFKQYVRWTGSVYQGMKLYADPPALSQQPSALVPSAGEEITRLNRNVNELDEALCSANEMCRSAAKIARRNGADTNWPLFLARLTESCVLQARVIHGHEVREDSATATAKVFKLRRKAQQPSGAQAGLVGREKVIGIAAKVSGSPQFSAIESPLILDIITAAFAEYDASPLPGDGGAEPVAWLMYSDNIARADRLDVCRLEPKNRHHVGAFPVYTHPSPLPASEPDKALACAVFDVTRFETTQELL